jgi:hypothetical protein
MGGRGRGRGGRGRAEERGRVSNGRYDRVRIGSGAGLEWSNRWTVLDRTGNDVEISDDEARKDRRGDRESTEEEKGGDGGGEGGAVGTSKKEQGTDGRERTHGMTRDGRNLGDERRETETDRMDEGVTVRKRNLQDRSPGQHEDVRTNRPRLDEFDVGKMCEEIDRKMRRGMAEIIEGTPEDFKDKLKTGLEVLLEGMKNVMNGTSDCVAEERRSREAEGMRVEEKIERMEERISDMKRFNDNVADDRIQDKIRRSEKDMEKKVRHAGSCLKLLDIDFGKKTDDRLWMVRSVITWMRDDVGEQEAGSFDRIMRRTRVQILGRETMQGRGGGGKNIFTVPVLLECVNKIDAADLDSILRNAGYFSTFHWPSEIMDFVREARKEVRKMGFEEKSHFVRIRPEERGGEIQIRADVKEKAEESGQ